MRKFLIILTSILILSADCEYKLFMQKDDTQAKIKAIFLYNFTQYFEWPETYKDGNFVVTILGNTPALTNELTKVFSTKTVGSQKIELKNISSVDALTKTNVLFIPDESSGIINEVNAKLKGKSTLVVTERFGLAKQGSVINFIVLDNKQKFELNLVNANKYGLKVSSKLSSLASNVIEK